MKTIREYCDEIENAIMTLREKGFSDNCFLPILPHYMAESKNAMFILIAELYDGYRGLLPSAIEQIVREMLGAAQSAYVAVVEEEAYMDCLDSCEEDDGDHPDYDPYCGCDMPDFYSADDIW